MTVDDIFRVLIVYYIEEFLDFMGWNVSRAEQHMTLYESTLTIGALSSSTRWIYTENLYFYTYENKRGDQFRFFLIKKNLFYDKKWKKRLRLDSKKKKKIATRKLKYWLHQVVCLPRDNR